MTRKILVAEIDHNELALLIAEAALGVKRPKDVKASEALESFDIATREGFLQAAVVATEYVMQCVQKAKEPHEKKPLILQ